MKSGDVVKGQACVTLTQTAGSLIGSALGGLLIDRLGVQIMLLTGQVFALAGLAVILGALRRQL